MSAQANRLPVSALSRRPFRPTWELGLSLLLHGLLVAVLATGERCTRSHEPMFRPDQVMIVEAVALPKSKSRMPTRAMHAALAPQGKQSAKAPPPPPTASDMALHSKDAPESKGVDRSADREALLREARKKALLDSMKDQSTPEGPEDSPATDPNGVPWDQAILGTGSGAASDPELARYVAACKNAILPHWTVLPSTLASHPDFEVIIEVSVSADGRMGKPRVLKGTGDSTFDNSALMALAKTGRLPSPPARWAANFKDKGLFIRLAARDKQ